MAFEFPVHHITLSVTDLERSTQWYCDVLHCTAVGERATKRSVGDCCDFPADLSLVSLSTLKRPRQIGSINVESAWTIRRWLSATPKMLRMGGRCGQPRDRPRPASVGSVRNAGCLLRPGWHPGRGVLPRVVTRQRPGSAPAPTCTPRSVARLRIG